MASPEPAIAGPSKPLQDIFIKGISDVRSLVTCKICTRFMYEPFTTKCGHTFCYACLSKWLGHGHRKRQCPDCRTKIKEEPCPNYTIRDIVSLLINNAAFIDDEDTVEELQEEQRQETSNLEKERTGPNTPGLFQGLFRNTYHDPIEDAADGVLRCPHCAWEVEDFYCERCGVDFGVDGDFWPEWSDDDFEPEFDDISQEGRLYEDDYDSEEPNEEDEAFIDDGEVEGGRPQDTTALDRHVRPFRSDRLHHARPHSGAESLSDFDSSLTGFSSEHDETSFAPGVGIDNDDSSLESSQTLTADDADSDLDSDSESSDGNSEGDGEDDDTESSEADSDDEPVVRQPGSQRRSAIPFRQAGSRQRTDTRLPATNVIDLTTPPTRHVRITRRLPPVASSAVGVESTTVDPAATGASRNIVLDEDANNGSESDAPIPIRRRKRERILLSDSEDDDDDAVDVQRERSRRRRLNQRLPTPTESSRTRQPFQTPSQGRRANSTNMVS